MMRQPAPDSKGARV